jgi:hypothetical protein
MNDEYGYITVGGERLPLTLRGYVALMIVGGMVIVGAVWIVLAAAIVALSPLYA